MRRSVIIIMQCVTEHPLFSLQCMCKIGGSAGEGCSFKGGLQFWEIRVAERWLR